MFRQLLLLPLIDWGLRDYGVDGQIGLEETPEEYVAKMVEVFREVRRVLRGDGTLWLNLGASYAGSGKAGRNPEYQRRHTQFGQTERKERLGIPIPAKAIGYKPKDLVPTPWMVAMALRQDGWWLRQDIIWHKPNPMPSSVTDRPTKAHEYIFLLSKSAQYFYDAEAVKEPCAETNVADYKRRKTFDNKGNYAVRPDLCRNRADYMPADFRRNRRSVWTVATRPYPEAHFATFPPKLIEPCILAGSRFGDIVLDPFAGSGTTLWVAEHFGRDSIGIELNPEYCRLIEKRMGRFQKTIFQAGVV